MKTLLVNLFGAPCSGKSVKMMQLAGEKADGWIGYMAPPDWLGRPTQYFSHIVR